MVIPKRRDYKLLIIVLAGGVLLSSLLIIANALIVRALTLPEALMGRDSFSQNKRQEVDGKRDRRDTVSRPEGVHNAPSPTPATSVSGKQAVVETTPPQDTATSLVVTEQPAQVTAPAQKPVDTSVAVRSVASNQTDKPVQATYYTSARMSSFERNRLYQGSLMVASIGLLLYIGTYVSVAWQWMRKDQVGVRKTIVQ